MAPGKRNGSGWHKQSVRHSNAKKFGKAGGNYADKPLLPRLPPHKRAEVLDEVQKTQDFIKYTDLEQKHGKTKAQVEMVEKIGYEVLTKHKSTSGTDIAKEPLKTEFLQRTEFIDKLTPEAFAELEDDNYHTELHVLRQEGKTHLRKPNEPDLELSDIHQYYGTEQYHKITPFTKTKGTDGVKYIEDNGYGWFVSDQVIKLESHPKTRNQPFLTIKLKPKPDGAASATIEDGNGKVLARQHYEWTDAKKDVTLFWENGVLMLPGER